MTWVQPQGFLGTCFTNDDFEVHYFGMGLTCQCGRQKSQAQVETHPPRLRLVEGFKYQPQVDVD